MTTITEGLADLKTLRKRIDKKRESINQYIARAEAIRDPLEKDGGSPKHVAAELQSIIDLERQYVSVRRRIAAANDSTMVRVLDEERSISDWLIWRREIAPAQRQWFNSVRSGIQQLRTKAQARGNTMVSATVVNADAKPDDIIVNINERELDASIEKLEEVLGTLDGQLSFKNATTEI